jgi:hypothetical protein
MVFKKGNKPWNIGVSQSEEWKKKMSLIHKGRHISEETRKKMSLSRKGKIGYWKGKNLSQEHKNKVRNSKKGVKFTQEHKDKIRIALKGKPKSEEHKKKLKIPKSIETKIKFRLNHANYNKEKNPNWQGGKSFEPYTTNWTDTLKRAIRERDHYTCEICGNNGCFVHHIDYNKENCNSINLITLCNSCHMKTNFNREKWIKYFKNILGGIR